MNIQEIIEQQVDNSWHHFRMLTEDRRTGVFACGYLRKTTTTGNIVDMYRPQADLVLILAGKGSYSDEVIGTVPLEAGDCIQRMPNRKHSTMILDDDWAELYISIGEELYESLAKLSVSNHKKPVLKTGVDFEMIQLYMEIYKKLKVSSGVELPVLLPKAIELFARATYLDRIHGRSNEEAEIIKLSVAYVRENVEKRLSVEDMATYVQMGYEKFRKLFLKYYGIAPGSFIQNERIRASQNLLMFHEMTIKEVALELGYRDSATFSKQFKKITGKTPTDFRKMYHN